jgi:hypothetical protein
MRAGPQRLHFKALVGAPSAHGWLAGELQLRPDGKQSRVARSLEPFLWKSGSGSVIFMSSTAAIATFIVFRRLSMRSGRADHTQQAIEPGLGAKGDRVNAVSPTPISF